MHIIKMQVSNSIVTNRMDLLCTHQMHYDALIVKVRSFLLDLIISHIYSNLGNRIISSSTNTLRLVASTQSGPIMSLPCLKSFEGIYMKVSVFILLF